jgi:hypothetical protein
MSNMKPFESPLPALPQFFDKLKPIETPELSYSKGLFAGWYHEKKLARMERVSDHEARISENRLRVTKATSDGILEALTFGKKYEVTLARYDHELEMMHLDKVFKQEVIREQVFKNQLLDMEVKDAGITLKMKMKEMGYDYQDEAGK